VLAVMVAVPMVFVMGLMLMRTLMGMGMG